MWAQLVRRGFKYRHGLELSEAGIEINDIISDYYTDGVEVIMSFLSRFRFLLPRPGPRGKVAAERQKKIADAKERRRAEQGQEEVEEEEEAANPTKVGAVHILDPGSPLFLPRE